MSLSVSNRLEYLDLKDIKEDQIPTTFEALPRELISHIAQFLPLASKGCFALSCRAARDTLGTHHWNTLRIRDQRQEHLKFLSQLSRDLPPNHVPCYHCRILHLCTMYSPDHLFLANLPRYRYRPTACHLAEIQGGIDFYIHVNFQFRTFQMAMKQYRLGLDYEVWLQNLGIESCKYITLNRFPIEFKAEARVVSDTLLFRTQHITTLPPGMKIDDLGRILFHVCPHITLATQGHNPNFPRLAECRLDHKHDLQQCVERSRTRSCNDCLTEYEVTQEQCGASGVFLTYTRWMDLGEGKTIFDPRWLSHLSAEYRDSDVMRDWRLKTGKLILQIRSMRSIRAAFEQNKHLKVDEETSIGTEKRRTLSAWSSPFRRKDRRAAERVDCQDQ